jgi:RNA polymerase sigma-70 factor (ECF subfamily)
MQDTESHVATAEIAIEELRLLAALKAGDETVFTNLVDTHHGAMVRLATQYVSSHSLAEEVAQEAWIAFLGSLDRFEGRSSLKTWLFRTLLNCARNRRRSEVHSVPFSALFDASEEDEPAVDQARFQTSGVWAGNWSIAPRSFGVDGETQLLRGEMRELIESALQTLSPAQREVVTLRDLQGWSSEEVCSVLDISEANQRVLLHRGRSRARAALEAHFDQKGVDA